MAARVPDLDPRYDENFFHEVVAVVEKKQSKEDLTDGQRWAKQQMILKQQLQVQTAAKKVKAEMEEALEAERQRKEQEEAERRAYEEELEAQKAAIAARKAQKEAALKARS